EGWPQRGMRCLQVYDNVFNWTTVPQSQSQRGGSSIWHDNTWLGTNSNSGAHTSLPYYRQLNAVTYMPGWAMADGANRWDKNDPNGLYFNGTAASNTTIRGGRAAFTTGRTMTPDAYRGMQVRNDHVGSACYLHSAFIISNTSTRIIYFYQASQTDAPLVFNSGDEFSIRKVLIALDQNGRGKGDLVNTNRARAWPNQQQETCFSWNNQNTDTGQVLRYRNDGNPNTREGFDYINLGAGRPAN